MKRPREDDNARGAARARGSVAPSGTVVKELLEGARYTERQEMDRARGSGTKRGLLRVKDEQEENEEELPMEDAESEEGFDVYECEIVTKKVTKKRTRPAEWQPYPFHSFIIFR